MPSSGEQWNGDIQEIIEKLNKADKESAPVIYSKDNNLNYVMLLDYGNGSYLSASYSLSVFNSSVRILLSYFIIVGVMILLLTAMVAYSVSQKAFKRT